MFKSLFASLFLLVLTSIAAAQSNDALEAVQRGNDNFHLGRYELAILEYRAALHGLSEHNARAHFNLGVCHHRLGRLRAAVAEYREALKLREGHTGHPGYSPAIISTRNGLGAVYSDKLDRDGIWRGMKERATYATSNATFCSARSICFL